MRFFAGERVVLMKNEILTDKRPVAWIHYMTCCGEKTGFL
jgi:hypothetical protein